MPAYRWLAAAAKAERDAKAAVPAVAPEGGHEPRAGGGLAAASVAESASSHGRAVAQGAEGSAVDGAAAPAYGGPTLLDAVARRRIALAGAAAGTVWTTAALAGRCGVTPTTAWKDLSALVAEGSLVAEGDRRGRRYRAAPAEP